MPLKDIHELRAWIPPYTGNSPISDGILKAGTGLIIFGPPKTWKSMLTTYTAHCISIGSSWFGFSTAPCVVIIFQAELPMAVHKERIEKFDDFNKFPKTVLFETNRTCKLNTTYGKTVLQATLVEAVNRFPKQHIVLILDPLYLLMTGKTGDESDVRTMLDNINELRDKFDLSVIIIHHSHKTRYTNDGAEIDSGADEAHGSVYLGAWCDTEIKLKRLNPLGQDNKIGFSFTYSRHANKVLLPFEVEWNRDTLQPTIVKVGNRPEPTEEYVTSRGLEE